MKSTGIIRRLDDIGRIVIPKEVRRVLHLPEGTPMEIGVDGRKIILQKYQAVGTWSYEEMWVWDNYNILISVPATDCNFTAALGYASKDELLRAQFLMENHPVGNKARLAAVNREIRKRQKGGKF